MKGDNVSVLHLANDYSGSTVYKHLCEALDKTGAAQMVYVPVRSGNLIGKNMARFFHPHSSVIYSHILSSYTRVNFFAKVKRILNDINDKLKVNEFDLFHAHTWYSDGAIAYELNKKYGTPYIVTVRSTDFNLFFKYLVYLRSYGLKILENAQNIVFITPSFQRKLYSSVYYLKHAGSLQKKSLIIPNGIDDFWIRHVGERKSFDSEELKLVYVGRFLKRKNLIRTLKAIEILNARGIPCSLTLVGGGGNDHDRVVGMVNSLNNAVYLGSINDNVELLKVLNDSHIFIMPSKNETFGLVYIEALSQGIPIVYTIDDGIYGFYPNNIGEAVKWKDIDGIVDAVTEIYYNYERYDFSPKQIVRNHSWEDIAQKYVNIYQSVFH